MDVTGIVERLKKKLGDAAATLVPDTLDPTVKVDRKALVEVAAFLKTEPDIELDFLQSVSGLDLKEKLQVVYHLWSYKHRQGLVLKVELTPTDLSLPTVSGVWAAANWLEREQYDLFGFIFTGHPDLRRIMLPEDWVGHPLRKDYVFPEQYHGIEHYRPSPFDQFKAKDELEAKARAANAPLPAVPAAPTTPSTPS
jgi:NADH-quinone oxidoreductase subunit C